MANDEDPQLVQLQGEDLVDLSLLIGYDWTFLVTGFNNLFSPGTEQEKILDVGDAYFSSMHLSCS